jgi:hypothetical protein
MWTLRESVSGQSDRYCRSVKDRSEKLYFLYAVPCRLPAEGKERQQCAVCSRQHEIEKDLQWL